ncbi:hypothetical protein HNR68_005294 [Saccharopolyspora hordei]|uniref:Uncharacterized protein n=1 Tax=Saccharopolyspora hordei TaxID=1838 RepID=A0A853AVK6_9PSEU|nr:hypothetical protein [Saccharopolyspora hordei]
MRTADVHRSVGDPPRPSGTVDRRFDDLDALVTTLAS